VQQSAAHRLEVVSRLILSDLDDDTRWVEIQPAHELQGLAILEAGISQRLRTDVEKQVARQILLGERFKHRLASEHLDFQRQALPYGSSEQIDRGVQ
jgi:hypothetical protein